MTPIDPPPRPPRGLLGLCLAATVALLITLPHLEIIRLQHASGSPLLYTPNQIHENGTRFDDISKLYSAFTLARYGTLTGFLPTAEGADRLYPNRLSELFVTLVDGAAVRLSGSPDMPYYLLGLFVALTAWVAWRFVLRSTGDAFLALACPLIMIFGYQWFQLGQVREWVLHPWAHAGEIDAAVSAAQYELNSFYRISALGASYAVFLLAAGRVLRAVDDEKVGGVGAWTAALAFGATFYAYAYYSAVLGCALLLLFAASAAAWAARRDDVRRRATTLNLLCIGSVGGVLGLPALYTSVTAVSGAFPDFRTRIGVVGASAVHADTVAMGVYFVLVLALVRPSPLRHLTLAITAAMALIENLNWLIGFNVQPGHACFRTALPFLVLATPCLVDDTLRARHADALRRWVLRPLVALVAIFVVYEAAHFGMAYARNTFAFQGLSPDEVATRAWMRDHAPAESVVASLSPELAFPLNIFLPVRLHQFFGQQYLPSTTNETLAERLAVSLYLSDATDADVDTYLSREAGTPLERLYMFYLFGYSYGATSYVSAPEREGVAQVKAALARVRRDPDRYLQRYPIDFYIKGSTRLKERQLPRCDATHLEPVFTTATVRVFRVKRPPAAVPAPTPDAAR